MDLESIVASIHALYAPNQDRSVVVSTQQQLQSIQKQPYAKSLAHELLQVKNDPNVQFFGALTYTVFIYNNEDQIDNEFVDCLAAEIVDACCKNLELFVIQKLLSNIALAYTKTKYCPLDSILQQMKQLNFDTNYILTLGLLSTKIYAEELNKWNGLNAESNRLIIDTILDSTTKTLLNNAIELIPSNGKIKSLWIECLQAWSVYLSRAEFDFVVTSDLNDYFTLVIELLAANNDLEALNLLYDIFDTHPTMVNTRNKQLLDTLIYSDWVFKFINANDIEENSKLSKFVALFLDSDMIRLAVKMIDPANDTRFEHLLNLTNQQGEPITDETFSVDLLGFWLLFVEAFINDTDSIETILGSDSGKIDALNNRAKQYFLRLSTIYWNKAHIIDDYKEYSDEFISFRRDIGELFESLFAIAREEIFDNLVGSVTTTFVKDPLKCMNDADTSLYLLNFIVSMLDFKSANDQLLLNLDSLFRSGFLSVIPSIVSTVTNTQVYQLLIKNTINFLSNVTWFYQTELGAQYMKDVLIFLFEYFKFTEYQESTSKAILSITDSCRNNLLDLLNDFENTANMMIVNKYDVELNVRSRIIRSYSSILQTVDNLDLQAEKVSNLLDTIYNESVNAYASVSANINNHEVLEKIDNYLLSMIGAVTGLAKGLQLPGEWDEIFENNPDKINAMYQYWKLNDSFKFKVHEKCQRLILLFTFPTDYIHGLDASYNMKFEFLEQVYAFLKAGLSEPLPGPFVLEYDDIIEYVLRCANYCQIYEVKKSINPPMTIVVQIYGAVVKSNHTSLTISKTLNLELGTSNLRVTEVTDKILFQQFDKVVNDVDIIQHIFGLFSDILARYPSDLIQTNQFQKIVFVGVKQLEDNCQQRFVIMALSRFWTNLIFLRKGQIDDVNYVRKLLIEQGVGASIAYSLFKGFTSTPRSIVEFYIEIIRALTAKYEGYLGKWIESAFVKINSERIANSKAPISESDINGFIKKLILSRGQRVSNRIIQEFWFTVSGMVDYGI